MIDPNKTYRTRDGRAVRIYATDGAVGTKPIHGAFYDHKCGWRLIAWEADGYVDLESRPCSSDLIEITLADELRGQVPWSALRPEIRWVALSSSGKWIGYENGNDPRMGHGAFVNGSRYLIGEAIAMPRVDPARWRETLVERPYSHEDYRLAP